MDLTGILVLAQGAQNTQEAPSDGVGIGLIVGAVLLVLALMALVFLVVSKRTRASRGGVEAAPGSRRPSPPPLESIERDR